MAGRPRNAKNYSYRLTDTNLKHLDQIRRCGDWSDDSSALRFCIGFTKTMLSIIPAAVAKNFAFLEFESTTVAPVAAPGDKGTAETAELPARYP